MKTEIVKVNDIQIECPYHKENKQHYVAIRSVCQVLGIDHKSQFERIKNDPILKDAYTDTVYAPDATGNRKQAMFCLPVKYIFGWIFSIQEEKINEAAKPTFLKYKIECYNALYDYFTGSSYKRAENLRQKALVEIEIQKLQAELEQNETYKRLAELKQQKQEVSKNLNNMDKETLLQQLDLFGDDE